MPGDGGAVRRPEGDSGCLGSIPRPRPGGGGYTAFRHLEAVLRLTQYCEQNRPDYGAMTDEELERAIGELGSQLEAP